TGGAGVAGGDRYDAAIAGGEIASGRVGATAGPGLSPPNDEGIHEDRVSLSRLPREMASRVEVPFVGVVSAANPLVSRQMRSSIRRALGDRRSSASARTSSATGNRAPNVGAKDGKVIWKAP